MTPTFKKLFCGFLLLGITFSMTNTFAAAKGKESLDKIVAVVNDNIISQSELNLAIANIKKQMAATHVPMPPKEVLEKRILDQLIDRKIQLSLIEQSGAHVTDEQLNKTLKTIADQNKVSVKELYAKVNQQGITTQAYLKELREEILLQQIQQQEVGSKISITPQEIDDFMRSASWKSFYNKEYHLEDLLIALPQSPTSQQVADAKKEADDMLAKIHKGMTLNQVAADEIGNPAIQTGDLGWMKLPQIPPVFSGELVHMKPNEVMGPVATPTGFHILRLAGLRNASASQDAATQRKQVEQLIYQRKLEEGLQSWTKKLRSEAFIKMHAEV